MITPLGLAACDCTACDCTGCGTTGCDTPGRGFAGRGWLKKLAVLGLITLLLQGCAGNRFSGARDAKSAAHMKTWQASGKLGIRSSSESRSMNFSWQQDHDDFEIHLHGALGLGSVTLQQHAGLSTLTTNEGTRSAATTELLLQEALGIAVPVADLGYWVKGLASPNSPISATQYNDEQRLQKLRQQGWHIQFAQYHDPMPLALPKKIIAQREDVTLTIIVKSWHY